MRTRTLLLSVVLCALPTACSSGPDSDANSSDSALSDDQLVQQSLTIVGAKVAGTQSQCNRCHDINIATLQKWQKDYAAAVANLQDATKSVDDKINYMRRDPNDPTSTFAPSRIGFLTAGTHFGTAATITKDKQPTLYRDAQLLQSVFAGKDDMFAQFKAQTLMPIEVEYDRLTATEYDVVATWMDKGMPKLTDVLHEEPRPTTCADDFGALAQHASDMKSKSWTAVNLENHLPMFACDSSDTLSCFNQQKDGKAIFPDSASTDYAKGWAIDGATVRVLRALDYHTFYWMRSSADGRFVSNGMSSGGSDGAVIADLAAALTGGTRDIGATARYDPDYWPDNKGFMFQGTPNGGVFCAQSLLTNPATTHISFNEPQCSALGNVGLYQTVGEKIGDDSIADHFIVNGKFASDNPGLSAGSQDLEATFGPDAVADVHVMFAQGNDASAGYTVKQTVEMNVPFEGDIMMSRSGTLLGARVAGETTTLGYSIRALDAVMAADGYRMTLRSIGRICMAGNKANFSFDERFLATHHYLTEADFSGDPQAGAFKEKGASDIWIADFVTGKKVRATHMQPGQFALYPHFRSDGWLYFLVRDANSKKEYIAATDWVLRTEQATPTP